MTMTPLDEEQARLSQLKPWSFLDGDQLKTLILQAEMACYAKDDLIAISPNQRFIIRTGEVTTPQEKFSQGDYFPYFELPNLPRFRAITDVTGWWVPMGELNGLEILPEFVRWRTEKLEKQYLLLWQQTSQWREQSQLRAQILELPLHTVMSTPPLTIDQTSPLSEAFVLMAKHKVGSVIVTDQGKATGILTEADGVRRVLALQKSVDAPISSVVSPQLLTYSQHGTVAEAALLMMQHRVRHLPLVDDHGKLVGIISERDIFQLQKGGLADLRAPLYESDEVQQIAVGAATIHRTGRQFFEVGMAVPSFTHLISSLNDAIAERVLTVISQKHRLDQFCWLAFGSEGRHEQTLVTDQDNGIVFADVPEPEREGRRQQFLKMAAEINDALAECGFTRCPGEIMACNPSWCLSLAEWQQRFSSWIRTPTPQALLNSSIFFDFRPLFGDFSLADALRDHLFQQAPKNRIFLHTLAANVLSVNPPLGRLGRFSSRAIDLKKTGTRLFVDAGRLMALSTGMTPTATVERLRQAGDALHRRVHDIEADIAAFEHLQGLRLRQQLSGQGAPNVVEPQSLNSFEQRLLFESLSQAKLLQNTIKLEYAR